MLAQLYRAVRAFPLRFARKLAPVRGINMRRILILTLAVFSSCSDHSNSERDIVHLDGCWSREDLKRGSVVSGTAVALYAPQIAIILQDHCAQHRLVVRFADRQRGYEMIDNMRNASRDEWHGGQPYLVRFSGVIGEIDDRYRAFVLVADRVDIIRRVSQP